jgi:ABC-type uncharacterized transport system substrate-binding protein
MDAFFGIIHFSTNLRFALYLLPILILRSKMTEMSNNLNIRKALILLALLIIPPKLFAHPHMFLDAGVTVRADRQGVQGVVVEWEFDVWFSASIIMDFDFNGDGEFDEYETSEIRDLAFSNLINYNYFTYFTVGNDTIPASDVSEFSVRKNEDRIIYTFFIPFSVPFEGNTAKFSVAVYDKTFFCDVAYMDSQAARYEGPAGFEMDYEIGVDEGITIYYDNAIVGNGRTGETYSGESHPDSVRIVLKK